MAMDGNTPTQNNVEIEALTIPRHYIFVLVDGTFAVRWSKTSIQELESGHYSVYHKKDFGASITDYELEQLKRAGLVEKYDKEQVTLCPLPERQQSKWLSPWEAHRIRSYYLNTTLPESLLEDVINLLEEMGLADKFAARARDGFVILRGNKGISFQKFDDAEKARFALAKKAPDAFANTVVAFIETTQKH
jgi:hypothetical protein